MTEALFAALYVENTPFYWVHSTPHGLIRGAASPAVDGWSPHQPYKVKRWWMHNA